MFAFLPDPATFSFSFTEFLFYHGVYRGLLPSFLLGTSRTYTCFEAGRVPPPSPSFLPELYKFLGAIFPITGCKYRHELESWGKLSLVDEFSTRIAPIKRRLIERISSKSVKVVGALRLLRRSLMMSVEKPRIDETFLLNKRIYSRLSIKLIKLILNSTR